MMNETKPETESTTEAVVESSEEVNAECSGEVKAEHFNADERTGTNQDAELHRPSNSSSRPSNSSSR
eukprot:scaffold26486_cov58-Skeletonema_marinoi.AAC.1